jgi:hypothetical protein
MVAILLPAVLDTETVGKLLYQVRRQVELYLKRLKSSPDRTLPRRHLGRGESARDIICKLALRHPWGKRLVQKNTSITLVSRGNPASSYPDQDDVLTR